jgi:GNAT superfamily N-acetyltransferase
MIEISASQVSPKLESLFDTSMPASLRCFAVLEGHTVGRILTDDPGDPTWGLVQEGVFGSIYPGGLFDAHLLHQLVTRLRGDKDVLIGLWPGDKWLAMLPPHPEYDGFTLDFTNRPIGEGLDAYLQVPDGCEIRPIDRELLERCVNYDLYVAGFGGAEKALREGLGFCLLKGDEILCEALAGPVTRGVIEIGVVTNEGYRGRGYATITCAHLIRTCEKSGHQTYWNCAKQNLASAAVARKLGYRTEREYKLLAWFKRE